jgi:hypothetical protein
MSDIKDDYDFARAKYYSLAEKGDEAIELMMELARDTEHPRAFEVLSNMMKQNAEVADRLMELQEKKKKVEKVDRDSPMLPDGSMTQNNIFVGSTADLQRKLLDKMKDIDGDIKE